MKDYVFKTSASEVFHFYTDKNNLHVKKLLDSGRFSSSKKLLNNITNSIYIDIDNFDICHIIYQDTDGNISYGVYEDEHFNFFEILKSKKSDLYQKYFKIETLSNCVHFFYILQKENMHSLIHQKLNGSDFDMPKIVQTFENSKISFSTCKSYEDLHLFLIESDNPQKIIHKIFTPSNPNWIDRPNIPINCNNLYSISSAIDKKHRPFIIYACDNTKSNSIGDYLCMISLNEKGMVQTQKTLPNSKTLQNISLSYFNGKYILTTQSKSFIYTQLLDNGKFLWETPLKASLESFNLCLFRSNVSFEKFFIPQTPVSFQKSLYIPLLDKLKIKDSFKNAMQDEINELKYKIKLIEKNIFQEQQ